MTTKEMNAYDYMVDSGIATAEELNLVKNIKGGTWMEVIDTVVSVRTGYNSLDQYIECEMEDFE